MEKVGAERAVATLAQRRVPASGDQAAGLFRRAEPTWPFRRDGRDYALTVTGDIEANNGETLGQLALAGVGVTRIGNFGVVEDIASGRLVPLLEAFNPGDAEPIHAVFVGGANMPARVRVFVDYLAEALRH